MKAEALIAAVGVALIGYSLFNSSNNNSDFSGGGGGGVTYDVKVLPPTKEINTFEKFLQDQMFNILSQEISHMKKTQREIIKSMTETYNRLSSKLESELRVARAYRKYLERLYREEKESRKKSRRKSYSRKLIEKGHVNLMDKKTVEKLADEGKVAVMPAAVGTEKQKENLKKAIRVLKESRMFAL